MAVVVTHTFVSPVADEGDPNIVGPNEWNDNHVVTGAAETATQIIAGSGLTGGGDLSTDRTLNVGAGTGITVNANDVALTIPVAVSSGGTGQTTEAEAIGELIQALTEDTSPDFAADFLGSYDASADTGKKLKLATVVREKLTADRTYYVRKDGSDTNTGLTDDAGGAFLTISKAVATVRSLDLQGFDVTIQVRAGTYTETVACGPCVGQATSDGVSSTSFRPIKILGDLVTETNVVITSADFATVTVYGQGSMWSFNGVTVNNTNGFGAAMRATLGGALILGDPGAYTGRVQVGGVGFAQLYGFVDAYILAYLDEVTFAGSAFIGIYADFRSQIDFEPIDITWTGSPAYGFGFVVADATAIVQYYWFGTLTGDGTVTGTRFRAQLNSYVDVFDKNWTAIPGDAAPVLDDSSNARVFSKSFMGGHVGFTFAQLPPSPAGGMTAYISDSSTASAGAVISGGGANDVYAWYDGSDWRVMGGGDGPYQPLDSDLTSIAALATTAAGRSVLTVADPGEDRVMIWDDDTNAIVTGTLANIAQDADPATNKPNLLVLSSGDVAQWVDWDDLPSGSGISEVADDTSPTLGGHLEGASFTVGTSSSGIEDLHVESGGTLDFANGNAVVTHSSGVLTVSTGDLRVTTAGTNAASVVTVGGAQTLTSKTLTSPVLTTPQINDTSSDHQYVFAVSELSADRNVTLPLLTGDDTFAFQSHTQTLSNKVIVGSVQALSGAGAVDITTYTTKYTSTGAGQALTLADGTEGQLKNIVHIVDGGSGVLTPTNFGNGTTITFTEAGDAVTLQFLGTDWWLLSNIGCTIA